MEEASFGFDSVLLGSKLMGSGVNEESTVFGTRGVQVQETSHRGVFFIREIVVVLAKNNNTKLYYYLQVFTQLSLCS